MQNWNRFPRVILALSLLIVLCAGMFAPHVEAKPLGAIPLDVIISEVAWGGTAVNSADEWIELYNTTGSVINLIGWTLSDGGDINVSLTGSIPAYGYYLLEADDDTTISDVFADQIYTGSLSNSGEILTLRNSISTTIDTANNDGTVAWNGGTGSSTYYSMERVGIVADTTTAWASNNNAIYNGHAADGITLIKGTPKQRTSSATSADLSLKMTVDNSTPSLGDNVVFTLTIRNTGFANATNVSIRDVLPVGLTYISNNLGATYNGVDTVNWNIGNIASGTSVSLQIIANLIANGVHKNIAEIISATQLDPDSIPNNNSTTEDDDDLKRVGSPTLNITNIPNNLNPNVGSNVVFTINVSNPDVINTATLVAVDAPLPLGLIYVSNDGGISYDPNSGIWTIGGLSPGAGATLNITAKVVSSAVIYYSAEVSSDDNFANNTATATVTPVASTQADLSLSQTWNRSTSAAGIAELKITVNNDDVGNTATGVQVKALLPSGLTYVSHTPGMTYNSSTGIWAVGSLTNGTPITLTISVRPSASGTSTTSFAEIWLSDQFDPNSTPGNGVIGEDDSDSDEVLVADLSLNQTVDIAGNNAVFTIVVTNSGPDNATGVFVRNSKIHTSYTYVSDNIGSPNYDHVNGIWNIGSLASGASKTLTVTTTIISLDENLAEVSEVNEVDPDSLPKNSSRDEDDDAGGPSADLSLTQAIISPSPYNNSDLNTNVTFRVTLTNSGFANATGVDVKDLLPSGLTYVSHTAPSGTTYSNTSGLWTVGALARVTSISLDIVAKVESYGVRDNVAEVWEAAQTDPDSVPGNSSITEDDYASVKVTTYRSVILNEIAWSGTAASVEDEWIELYNLSPAEITITGWKIRKNSCGATGTDYITLSGKISSGGYFLLERGATASDNTTVFDVAANQIYLVSVPALLDSGETLYLCDNTGKFIDTANQEGSGSSNPWPKGGLSPNYPSMERISNSAENDESWGTNNGVTKNGKNAIGGLIYGTPGKKNSTGSSSVIATATPVAPTATPAPVFIPPDPRPIINEILPRPGFDWNKDGKVNVFDEFIEIKNLTSIDITLKDWKLDDELNLGSDPFTLPDVTLKPGQRMVFYGLQTNILLSDGGDTVRLISPSGKIYDAYTYAIARAEDQSICRLPDGNVYNGWFEDCVPTPNLNNSREGSVPSMPDAGYQSPVCQLPDTLPADFLFAECRGYGANIWHPYFWDQFGMKGSRYIPQNTSKWETIIE